MTAGAEAQAPLIKDYQDQILEDVGPHFHCIKHWEQSINTTKASAFVMYTVPQLN